MQTNKKTLIPALYKKFLIYIVIVPISFLHAQPNNNKIREKAKVSSPDLQRAIELPQNKALLVVKLVNKNNTPYTGVTCSVKNIQTNISQSGITNSIGEFRLVLEKGSNYQSSCYKYNRDIVFTDILKFPQTKNPYTTLFTLKITVTKTKTALTQKDSQIEETKNKQNNKTTVIKTTHKKSSSQSQRISNQPALTQASETKKENTDLTNTEPTETKNTTTSNLIEIESKPTVTNKSQTSNTRPEKQVTTTPLTNSANTQISETTTQTINPSKETNNKPTKTSAVNNKTASTITSDSYTFNNVLFAFNQHYINKNEQQNLNKISLILQKEAILIVEIKGHTDSIGSKKSNQNLSIRRALSVRNYLIKKGVQSNRIFTKGFGLNQPVATNKNWIGRQKNRRCEIRIVQKD